MTGRRASIRATLGIILGVVAFRAISAESGSPPEAPDAAGARAAYARLQALAGRWTGVSTRGWTEDVVFRPLAAGVLETAFDAHPGETMATVFYLDGDALWLTHHCLRNHPRLKATTIGEGGRAISFTFVDGAGIPNRDSGHMDRATYRFGEDGRVTTSWTWHQDGKDLWTEDIVLARTNRAGGPR